MPYKESGDKYNSPEEALADALPEGADASEVMTKLKDMGYDLKPAAEAVGVSIEMETEEAPEETEASEEEEAAPKEKEAGLDLAMGVMDMPEPMAKKRDKVAGNLMDKFKKGMV